MNIDLSYNIVELLKRKLDNRRPQGVFLTSERDDALCRGRRVTAETSVSVPKSLAQVTPRWMAKRSSSLPGNRTQRGRELLVLIVGYHDKRQCYQYTSKDAMIFGRYNDLYCLKAITRLPKRPTSFPKLSTRILTGVYHPPKH
jgi:hypothetical protein